MKIEKYITTKEITNYKLIHKNGSNVKFWNIKAKAKSFWNKIKPKVHSIISKAYDRWLKFVDKLLTGIEAKIDGKLTKVEDHIMKRLGIDPVVEADDASNIDDVVNIDEILDNVKLATGSVNDQPIE